VHQLDRRVGQQNEISWRARHADQSCADPAPDVGRRGRELGVAGVAVEKDQVSEAAVVADDDRLRQQLGKTHGELRAEDVTEGLLEGRLPPDAQVRIAPGRGPTPAARPFSAVFPAPSGPTTATLKP
jgi:hypothetical protein